MNTTTVLNQEDRLKQLEADIAFIKLQLKKVLQPTLPATASSDDSILSVKEVAAFLSVEPAAIYAMCTKGELPFYRVGKFYRFKKAEILQWMEQPGTHKNVNVEGFVNSYLQKNILKG